MVQDRSSESEDEEDEDCICVVWLFASLESVVVEEWIHRKKRVHLSCTNSDWLFLQTHISFRRYFLSFLGCKYSFLNIKFLSKIKENRYGPIQDIAQRRIIDENIFPRLAIQRFNLLYQMYVSLTMLKLFSNFPAQSYKHVFDVPS